MSAAAVAAGGWPDPLAWLADAAAEHRAAGLHRTLQPRRPDSGGRLDLASNDYLGLARDPRVLAGAAAALERWGAGATGSRLVTGTTEMHAELERALAGLVGAPAALVFSSGYLANLGAVTALAGPDCLIVSDAANHASLIDACRLSRSRVAVVPHGDQRAAARALAVRPEPRALVLLEAVNSADGDLLPLPDWQELAVRYGALLLVDDAHGLGVRGAGRGSVAEAGLAAEPNVVSTVTLSKALGAQGGAVLGPRPVIEHLIDRARSFVFDTGLNPAAVGAALAAVRIIADGPELAASVRRRAAELAAICGVPAPDAAVLSVIVGEPLPALERAQALRELGIAVGCFRPPSVPPGTARLRLAARADLTGADLARFRSCWQQVTASAAAPPVTAAAPQVTAP
ncbi:8-amino-7-oxononanoate synthase [Jatrophihabitans sp.]|uniref:8-amino-7-oxononanoate synthase n=1 Tax=Jatrophihabitans sp. TaxID=1932789 RepID=UPI002C53AAEE|nr:8-amino-7-oxononanoate synthase [Jatrophihabitans sp.]